MAVQATGAWTACVHSYVKLWLVACACLHYIPFAMRGTQHLPRTLVYYGIPTLCIACLLTLRARWPTLPAGIACPLALQASKQYMPRSLHARLHLYTNWKRLLSWSLRASWHCMLACLSTKPGSHEPSDDYMPAGSACPLALLARWHCMPARTTCPLVLHTCWHYMPANITSR